MGLKPSKADPDVWMRLSKDESVYEYIAVYVDDLAIAMKILQNSAEHSKKSSSSNSKEMDQWSSILAAPTNETQMVP